MSEKADSSPVAPAAPEGESDLVERMAEAAVRDYNLSTEQRWVRKPMPTLEIVNQRFERHLRQGLFQLLRRSAEVRAAPVTVQRFGEFVQQLANPASLNVATLNPLRGHVLISFEAAVVGATVDLMYGGNGSLQAAMEGRDFSPTEQRVIQRLVQVVCAAYNEAWREIYPLELAHQRSEVHPQFAAIASPAEMSVVTSMQLTLGGFEGALHICKPYGVLEPLREVLYGPQQASAMAEDRRWVSQLSREIQQVEVSLVAELAQPALTVGQVLAMKPGDFIQLDRLPLIAATVEGTPVFACSYGTHDGRYALRVEQSLHSAQPHWLGEKHVH
ncbi:flagellar motor switch protein FliM [Xenophilus arseniciresistens]|uniref:Flagellar motor switch protein FliM n=1 Tax=Xenophilus arseniciresistens TaxID=1283306 RepID=A0AAE3N6H2_9BURK|nr:flagellar motor switch protein FliM [Xenophilus arseniciresistens]MDA7415226.1 flagellar motor switch protein FliM [Xenophilus arseniciresistens]